MKTAWQPPLQQPAQSSSKKKKKKKAKSKQAKGGGASGIAAGGRPGVEDEAAEAQKLQDLENIDKLVRELNLATVHILPKGLGSQEW